MRFAGIAASLLLPLFVSLAADAQQCGLDTRVPFAGHTLPLEGNLVVESIDTEPAFPDWLGDGLTAPLFATFAADNTNRLFIVEQAGLVRVLPNDPNVTSASLTTFLDIGSRVEDSGPEEGLLGLAFHPDYHDNGYLYVHHTSVSAECAVYERCQQVVRYRRIPGDPSQADPNSKFVVLEIDRPGSSGFHNGGMIAFGGDGFLYIAVGDQGLGALAQDTQSLRGKILRIDVDSGTQFNPGIPADNPFANEVWHYGLRNPWRFSFDRDNPNDLWIGDVGEADREEVNWITPSEGGGLDLGWPDCEGTRPTGGGSCDPNHRFPDIEYSHANGRSGVTGGYVYRGSVPSLVGQYIFGELNGEVFSWDRVTRDAQTGLAVFEPLAQPVGTIVSFAEDESGELYFWNFPTSSEGFRRFSVSGTSPGGLFPELLSETGFFSQTANVVPAPGMIEYDVASPLWSDAAAKVRWMALPGSETIAFSADGNWEFPVGTALVKQFEIDQAVGPARRVETRIMLRQNSRWVGLTYRWNVSQTDAQLLFTSLREDIPVASGGAQNWLYPSPGECLGCHSTAAGEALGLRSRQINRDFDYPSVTDNQLHAWNCIGLFDTDIGAPEQFPAHANLSDAGASVSKRARAYLDSNCASCHQPGTALTNMDLRSKVLLGEMNLIGEPPIRGDLGLPSPHLVDPGNRNNSVLWLRTDSIDEAIRMARGTLIRHVPAIDLLADWIELELWDSGSGSAFVDSDEDGIADSADNCDAIGNPSQGDADSDGLGDACDPDLMANLQALATGPTEVLPGDNAGIGGFILNSGPGDAATSQSRLYLSDDEVVSESDYLVGSCFVAPLAGNTNGTCSTNVVVPLELEPDPGFYYWIACADGLEILNESDETDNCGSQLVQVPEPEAAWMQVAIVLAAGGLAAVGRRRRQRLIG